MLFRSFGAAGFALIGLAALPQVLTSAPPAGEQDLRRRGELAADRPLPDFGTAPVRLGPWLMLAGALLLALRLLVR